MATAVTPQTDVTSEKVTWLMETAVSASLQKIKSIKNQHKYFFPIFYLIKSQTSDSFVNHFDDRFAYLKTLDFSYKNNIDNLYSSLCYFIVYYYILVM